MSIRIRSVLMAAFMGQFLAACAQSYEPALSPRVVLTGSGGVVRNGQNYGGLLFGTRDAVQGNHDAEAEAESGKSLAIGGVVLGVSVLGLGTAALVADSKGNDNLALGLVIGEAVSAVTSILLLNAAGVHARNAINRYNDSLATSAQNPPPLQH